VNSVSRFLRPGWMVGHVLVLVALLVCLRLAWWQLDRSEDADGTAQNLGYALLWPAFGVAFVYMWVKFLRLEAARSEQEELEHQQSLELMLTEAESFTAQAAGVTSVTGSERSGDGIDGPGAGTMDAAPGELNSGSGRLVDEGADEDPELAAYNRALAALAEKDRRAR
jgi:DNA-binding transcriptional regulator of glucitol operon